MGEEIKLWCKILEVMRACSRIEKDGRNDHFGYKYVKSETVMERVSSALLEQGLVTIYQDPVIISEHERQKASGGYETLTTVKVTITIIDSETGAERSISGLGSGVDHGDKSVAKAQTQAIKYAWLSTLCISTGEDPEADPYADRGSRVTTKDIIALIEQKSIEKAKVLEYINKKYGAEGLSDLKNGQLTELQDALKNSKI